MSMMQLVAAHIYSVLTLKLDNTSHINYHSITCKKIYIYILVFIKFDAVNMNNFVTSFEIIICLGEAYLWTLTLIDRQNTDKRQEDRQTGKEIYKDKGHT